MAELDADRALALTYVPAAKRAALDSLWRLDAALGQVLAGGREPLISQIKLVWWRDALASLDSTKAPAEPVLQAVARDVLPASITGAELAELEQGWSPLLSPDPLTGDELAAYSSSRGALLFRFSARVLHHELSSEMEQAGEGWSLVDLARHSNAADAEAAFEAAVRLLSKPVHWPVPLRPLGMLAALARRDVARPIGSIEPHGAPGRMLTMLKHRLTGR